MEGSALRDWMRFNVELPLGLPTLVEIWGSRDFIKPYLHFIQSESTLSTLYPI